MYYKNNFPEFLEAISIGPNPDFLLKNTTFCEFASGFPQEVELMYDRKSVKRSSDPLNKLRDFSKKLIIYGPDLDVATLNFFVRKVNHYHPTYVDVVLPEVEDAFKIHTNYDPHYYHTHIAPKNKGFITNKTAVNADVPFLFRLAALMKTCKKPCNYFKLGSSSLGTLTDFTRGMSDATQILGAAGSELLHAPVNISAYVLNKIKPTVRKEWLKMKVITSSLYTDGVKPFFSSQAREEVKADLAKGITPDNKFRRIPCGSDTSTYFAVSQAHSEHQQYLQEQLGDCFRRHTHAMRYNPFDPEMNVSYAKRKYMGVRNGNVKALIDILGSPAPAKYVTENTYKNALDVPKTRELYTHEDTPKARKYDTYDGPSKGSESVVTAGQGTGDAVAASGSGLENVPNTGKVYEFGFGEVKLTAYGYAKDECPDTGSELCYGNRGNMIVPLKTIAVAPEFLPKSGNGMVKPGDVLIITCTDKQGNTFTERRQVGDSSGSGLAGAGSKFKFLIDEFQPNKVNFPSKLAGRTDQLKLTIRVADTKEDLPKWNVVDASKFAPIFYSKADWDRVLRFGGREHPDKVALMKSGAWDTYIKWSANEPTHYIKRKSGTVQFDTFKGCT